MKGFERFLSKEELSDKISEWKFDAKNRDGSNYTIDRLDDDGYNSISELHGISFLKDIIPRLIRSKKEGEKVKILDTGAGAALFADEVRKAFPNEVKVFSTGLRKKIAKDYRKKNKQEGESKLHIDDLKWRSILELSDFEEFDLIIDTMGEYHYSIIPEPNDDTGIDWSEVKMKAMKYLTTVIKKLKPGGFASIITKSLIDYSETIGQQIITDLEKDYNVKVTIPKDHLDVLRIEKQPTK